MLLPKSSSKNQLHEALANGRVENARRLIATQSEAYLVECFEGRDRCYKSCLHVIAAMSDTAEATKLCRELMQKIKNSKNREILLKMTTTDEFELGGWRANARVAAIHIAAYSGNSGVVRLLCEEYGVDVNSSTSETLEETPKRGMTPLEWATRKGHTDVVRVLLGNKADVNASRHTDGVTPLYIAAQNGHTEVVKLLLDNKADADVNASSHTGGTTPLYIAAQNGHTEVVKLLLDNKADVNASRHTDGVTPLYMAAQNGHTEVVKLLLDNRADASKRNGVGLLYVAAQWGHTEVVKLLLDNKDKADVNASIDNGTTPLYMAAQEGHTEVVKLLLRNNADVNARRGDGPIDAARRNHHLDIVKLLQ